jgi:hypothetical protein
MEERNDPEKITMNMSTIPILSQFQGTLQETNGPPRFSPLAFLEDPTFVSREPTAILDPGLVTGLVTVNGTRN